MPRERARVPCHQSKVTSTHRILALMTVLCGPSLARAEGTSGTWQMPQEAPEAEAPAVATPTPAPAPTTRPPVPPAYLASPIVPRYAVVNFGTQPYRYVPSPPAPGADIEQPKPEPKPPFFDLAAGTE